MMSPGAVSRRASGGDQAELRKYRAISVSLPATIDSGDVVV